MSFGLEFTVYLVLVLITGIAGAVIAQKKNRLSAFWMVLCLLFPPAIFILMLLPAEKRKPLARKREDDDSFADDNLDEL